MAERSFAPDNPIAPEFAPLSAATARSRMGQWGWMLGLLLAAAVLGGLGWTRLARPLQPVTLQVNGRTERVQSRQHTVAALLREQGYTLTSQDIVYPPLAAPLSTDQSITLILARDVTLVADGRYQRLLTHAERVGDLLHEQGLHVGPQDAILLDGRPVSPEAHLPLLAQGARRPRGELSLARAVPIEVDDDGFLLAFATRARTLGEALLEQGIVLHEGDDLNLPLDSRIQAGLKVRIRRTTPVVLAADGRTVRTRTRSRTVGALLTRQGLTVRPLDLLTPAADTPITADLTVTLTRVDHQWLYEREPIPFQRRVEYSDELELDTQGLIQVGREGSFARETLVIYENGQERERILQREYLEAPPQDEIYAYGTRVVLRTVETPDGPRQYWRRIRMHATSYTAATSGKSRDHPAYGITRTGVLAGFGVVAVDPRYIPLRSNVYVPGYGIGFVGDTGGAIKGRRIDLGYDEWNLRLWYNSVDVYLLAPAPPASQIPYVLP